jgi:hypothetical protein
MLRVLKNLTFVYVQREDRVLAAINAAREDAWACWLTRRLALAVIERATDYVARTSDMAQRAPADLRGEFVAVERDAAIAKTAQAMSVMPPAVLQSGVPAAQLAERLTIAQQGAGFRLELSEKSGEGAAAVLKRDELQRILQMLQGEIAKAGWFAGPAKPQAAPTPAAGDTNPARH